MYGVKSVYTPFFVLFRELIVRVVYILYICIASGWMYWSRHKFIIVEAKKGIMATYLREMWN